VKCPQGTRRPAWTKKSLSPRPTSALEMLWPSSDPTLRREAHHLEIRGPRKLPEFAGGVGLIEPAREANPDRCTLLLRGRHQGFVLWLLAIAASIVETRS
jgi:hypothetical protein